MINTRALDKPTNRLVLRFYVRELLDSHLAEIDFSAALSHIDTEKFGKSGTSMSSGDRQRPGKTYRVGQWSHQVILDSPRLGVTSPYRAGRNLQG